ncbi:hypothetical protein SAMN04487897_14514 [Paenibacillus sp. yr247]|nr:hypothetical protein SAMN04487897_14514 [Paenibacillus sp. yr247]
MLLTKRRTIVKELASRQLLFLLIKVMGRIVDTSTTNVVCL